MAFSQKSASTKTTKGNRPSYLGENTLIYTSSTNRPNTTLANPMYLAKFHYKGTQYGLTKARSNSLLGQGSPKALSVTQKAASSPVNVKPKVKRSETSIISDLPSCKEMNESKSQIIEEEDMLKLKLKTHSDGNIDPNYEWMDEKKSINLQENSCLIQNVMTEKYTPKSPLPQKPNLTKPINKKPNDMKKENSLNLVMAKSTSYGIEERDTTPKLKAKPATVPAPTKSSQKTTPKANPALVIDCNLNAVSKTKREEDKKKMVDENSPCLASTPTLHTQERESFGCNDLNKINKVPTSMMSVHKVSQSVQIPKGIDLKENKDILLKQISENEDKLLNVTRSSQTLAPKTTKENKEIVKEAPKQNLESENKHSTFKSSPTLAPKTIQIPKENKETSKQQIYENEEKPQASIKSSQTLTPKAIQISKEKENKETSKQTSENQESKLLISTKSVETLAPKTTTQNLIPKTSPTSKERFHNRPNTTLLETSLDHSLMATVIVKDSKPRSTKVSNSATLQRDQYSSKLVASKVSTNPNKLSSPNRASSSRMPLAQTRSSLNMNFTGNNELQPSKHSDFSFKMQYFKPIDDSKLTEYIRDINESQCFKRKEDKNQSVSYNVDKSFNLNKNLESNPSTQTILSTKNMNKENQENTVNPENNSSKFKKNSQSNHTTVKKDQPIKKKEYITFSAHHSTQEDEWISHKSKENIEHKIESHHQKEGRVSDVSLLPKKLLMSAHKPKVKDLNIKIESKASTTYSKLDKLLQELKSNPSIDATRIPRGGMEPDEQEGGLFSGSGIASSSSSTNCSVNKSYINTLRKVTGSQS